MPKRFLVTGGAGFIGSELVRYLIQNTDNHVMNIDKLTYAGNLESLKPVENNERYSFRKIDICSIDEIIPVIKDFEPDYIMHLAAESHVDRSIDGPREFVHTNINGTYNILEAARGYWMSLENKDDFRFLHISTDEVFGSLGSEGLFKESTPYDPSSPYSASKAASDHLVRAWHRTFLLPTLITNCSNNYGPYQFPEKLIPVIILNALKGKKLPVYGKGENVRDWLFVEDHVKALLTVIEKGRPGETYNIGSRTEKQNIEVVRTICSILDELAPNKQIGSYESLIEFVTDRPGHDLRYAIDPAKIEKELGWKSSVTFEEGIKRTVKWYIDNREWCDAVMKNKYKLERIGLGKQ